MLLPVLGLGLGLLVSACGDDSATDGTARPTPSATVSSSEDPLSDPTPTGRPGKTSSSAVTTVTGVLADGVEQGCLLLQTGDETLQLVGVTPDQRRPGARVTVTGTRSPGLMTTCQQGVPFRVTDLRPAD